MQSRADCWNLIYHMPPQLRSLFIIKEALNQWKSPFLSYSFCLSGIWSSISSLLTLTFIHNFSTSLIARAFRGNGPRLPAPQHTSDSLSCPRALPSSPRGLMRRWELLVSEFSPRLVLLFNWSFIGDNQFISISAPGCIDLLSQRGVKCTVPLPLHYKPQALILIVFVIFIFFYFLFLLLQC